MTEFTAARIFSMCAQNYHPRFSKDESKATVTLWLETFKNRDDGLMITATNLVMLSVIGRFPGVGDFQAAIAEILRTQMPEHPALPAPRSRTLSPAVQKALAMVREGKSREYLVGLDVSGLLTFARSHWPDITEELVRRNLCELETARAAEATCAACTYTPQRCLTNGYRPVFTIQPDGWMAETMVPCHKRQGRQGRQVS